MNAHYQIAGQPKAPEGWRTPKRFALCRRSQNSRQRLGLRLAPLVRFPLLFHLSSAAFAPHAQLLVTLCIELPEPTQMGL
jgi:hypothetical protein